MRLEECCDGDEIILDELEDWISLGNGTRHIWIGSRCVAVISKWGYSSFDSYNRQFLDIVFYYISEVRMDNWFYKDWLGFESEMNRISRLYLERSEILRDVFSIGKAQVVHRGGGFSDSIYKHIMPMFEMVKYGHGCG